MKKLLFLLLLPIFCFGQVSNGTETEFEALKVTSPQTVTNPTNLTTTGADGTQGKVLATEFAKTATTVNINGDVQSLAANRTWRTAQADTGVLTFAGLTQNSGTTINIGAVTGYVVDNETNPSAPTWTYVNYAGETNKTVTTVGSGLSSYVMLSSAGVISFQNTFPTSAERKAKIWLGKVGHPTGTITTVGNEPDFITSPLAQYRDLAQSFGYINNGVLPYANGANLNFNVTGGVIWGDGINFVTDKTNPDYLTISPSVVTSFLYRTQTGGVTGVVTSISPGFYDSAGTVTAVGGGAGSSTLQYIWSVPGLGYIVTYGQTVYSTLNDAIAAVGKESNVIYPNLINNSILIGVLAVNKTATQLNNVAQAKFFPADKFGQIIGATAGTSTGTMQTSYNNSLAPQIVTSTTLGAVEVRRGSASDTDIVLKTSNGAGNTTASIAGNGAFTASGAIVSNEGLGVDLNVLSSTFISPNIATDLQQGYAWDGTNHYLIGASKISKRDSSWAVVVENNTALTGISGVNHLGDGVYLGGFLYIPVENYPAVTGMKIAKYDATTLSLVTTYDISAQGHEAGALTTDGSILYITSFLDGSKIWKYDTTGNYLGLITISTPFTNGIQGLSYYSGDFYISEQTKLSRLNITGTTTTFLGYLPGDLTNTHRGEGLEVVSGVFRVSIIGASATNIYYLSGSLSDSSVFSVNSSGVTSVYSDLIKKPRTTNTEYTDIENNSLVIGTRGSGVVSMLASRTSSTTSTGMFHLAVQNADVARTSDADIVYGTGFESGTNTIQTLTSSGQAFQFKNGGTLIMTMGRNGNTIFGNANPFSTTKLVVSGSITAASALARGQFVNTTLVASANNDVLVGFDVSPTFTNGAFTGVKNISLRAGSTTISDLTLSTAPTTSAGTYDILTRNTSTGVVEKIPSTAQPLRYKALLTQTGTGAPTATILVNTLGATVTYGYSAVGTYTATTSSSILTANKTVSELRLGESTVAVRVLRATHTNSTTITMQTFTSAISLQDGIIDGRAVFEIEVYP